ncbi:MAG: aminotransferase class III-fold pyridoxal phosphate-dependent enzyme [Acidobacteria bacterium]|nr:aminotransferase class III-fold pyridoxal phosphate-dependent enzyme [Acidobacteriota bacterium]
MILPVYLRPAVTITHGDGCYLFDTNGKRYLDFISGIGVNALGHW